MHRDLKPENILLSAGHAVVADLADTHGGDARRVARKRVRSLEFRAAMQRLTIAPCPLVRAWPFTPGQRPRS